MSQTTSVNVVDSRGAIRSFWRALLVGVLGGSLAAVGNLVIYYTYQALTGIDLVIPTGPGGSLVPLTAVNVALTSFFPGLGAGIVLWLLSHATTQPMQIFLGISISVLLFSFTAPLGLATIPDNVRVVLVVMHIIAAGAIAGVVARYASR